MKVKGYLLATAGSVVAVSSASVTAGAADLPAAMPTKAPAMVTSWEGAYIGLHAGANWQQATSNLATYSPVSIVTHANGFIGGGQIGYNWQHGTFVYGVEADASWLTGTGNNKGVVSNRIEWLATFRGRAGMAVGDTMAYVTGGLALGGVKNTAVICVGCLKSETKTRVGWTIGGGVEHMLTRNWTLAMEALYVDLGKSDTVVDVADPADSQSHFTNQAVIGRVKVNYKW